MADDGRQHRRQSSDFGEIVNFQTEMSVSTKKWDSIFHNWENPEKCSNRKKSLGCEVCTELEQRGFVERNGKIHSVLVGIIGDVHSDLDKVKEFSKKHKTRCNITVGDLGIYANFHSAQADKKSFLKNIINVTKYITEGEAGNFDPLSTPLMVVKGNHDDYENMMAPAFVNRNIHYAELEGCGNILSIGNLNILVFGGIYSPVKSLHPTKQLQGRDRRFFTKEDLTKVLELAKDTVIDIVITHEAMSGVLPAPTIFPVDEGVKFLNTIVDAVQPALYIHGHHHKNYNAKYKNTDVMGLGNFSRNPNSYIIINTLTREIIADGRQILTSDKKV